LLSDPRILLSDAVKHRQRLLLRGLPPGPSDPSRVLPPQLHAT
jgi:hypothetical protein